MANIVWMSWKDIRHPQAGGAEKVQHEILRRLVNDGHQVTLLSANYSKSNQTKLPYPVLRGGNRYTVYVMAWWNYRKAFTLKKPDLVIDEVNTLPFFSKFYAQTAVVQFFHQLAGRIWFYEMIWPLSWLGYLVEPLYLRLISNQPAIVVSDSTKQDIMRHGFQEKSITTIREARSYKPVKDPAKIKKYNQPSLLCFGAVRSMKRTLEGLEAFEIAKVSIPDLQLHIAGSNSGNYGQRVARAVSTSPYRDDIQLHGYVSDDKAKELYSRCHFLLTTPVKEGWGLTVTDAASQGTIALAYDVDGIRDSTFGGRGGVLVVEDPQKLADSIVDAFSADFEYTKMVKYAWGQTLSMTYDRTYSDFLKATKLDRL